MKKISYLLLAGLMLAAGCGLWPAARKDIRQPSAGEKLNWSVEVKFWSGRFKNPEIREDTPVRAGWDYSAASAKNRGKDHIYKTDGEDTYLLKGIFSGEFEGIYRLLEKKEDIYKLEHIYSTVLREGPFFYLSPADHPPVVWYHPDRKQPEGSRRFNFHRSSARPGDWLYQRVEREDDNLIYTLIYEPEDVEVKFTWSGDKPWWSKAVWRRRGRVVAVAETEFG